MLTLRDAHRRLHRVRPRRGPLEFGSPAAAGLHGPAAPGHRPAHPDGERDAHRATLADVGPRQIRRKPVLGGLINEYTYAAWRMENLQVTGRILTGNRAVSSGRVQPSSGAMLPGAAGELW